MTTKSEIANVKENEVAVAGVSQDFMDMVAQDGDMGYSEKAEDSLIPILGILQDNSAEVKRKHEKYIEGVVAGDMIIRSLGMTFSAENAEEGAQVGILFQPCGFDHVWVEWMGEPGEGAPVNQFPFEERPDDAKEVPDPANPDRTVIRLDNGNRLVETRYHYGNILLGNEVIPCVIPMSGTNHTVSRQWTATMKRFKMVGRDQLAPSFFRMYEITTSFVSKGAQSWFKYKIVDRGQIGDQNILQMGFDMMKAVAQKEVSAEVQGDAKVVDDAETEESPV